MSNVNISRGGQNEGRQFHTDAGALVKGRFIFFKELGSKKFMVMQRFMGRLSLHIRNYMLDEEEYIYVPTKRGVVLNKQQTRDLINSMDQLATVIKHVSFMLYLRCKKFI